MRRSLAGLLPSLSLVLFANASLLGNDALYTAGMRNLTQSLFPRVRAGGGDGTATDPMTTSELFLIDSGPGGCSSQQTIIDGWLEEVYALHDAIQTMYARAEGDLLAALLWMAWFGIEYDDNDIVLDLDDDFNEALWKNIGDHIGRVTQFLAGRGLRDPQVPGENPRLFCSGAAGVLQSWEGSIARDHQGNNIILEVDPVTEEPKYLRLGEAFREMANNPSARPFWFSAFNGYDIDGTGKDDLCSPSASDGRIRVAKTSRPAKMWIPSSSQYDFGLTNRHILFCPPAFSPTGSHSYESLAMIIANYPTPKGEEQTDRLDYLMPVSATLYHELYHLTDDDNTPDQDYRVDAILESASDPAKKVANTHNPETYTFFALAAYILLNAPGGTEPCFYKTVLPLRASDPFDEF